MVVDHVSAIYSGFGKPCPCAIFKKKLGGRTEAAVVYRQWGLQQRWGSILVMHTCTHSNNLYIRPPYATVQLLKKTKTAYECIIVENQKNNYNKKHQVQGLASDTQHRDVIKQPLNITYS